MNLLYRLKIRELWLSVIFALCFFTVKSQESSKVNKKGVYKNIFHIKFKASYADKLDKELKGKSYKKAKKGQFTRLNIKEVDEQNKKYHVQLIKRLFRPSGKFEEKHRKYGLHLWYKVKFDSEFPIEEVIEGYKNITSIEFVEAVNAITFADGYTENTPTIKLNKRQVKKTGLNELGKFPNDSRYAEQWHYHNTGQSPGGIAGNDIKLEEAWNIEKGNSKVIVAIMDTGIDINHPDLKENIWVNIGEIPNNGIDDDNNGYIDDVHGYNFADDTGTIPPASHGTHVAGTVAAETNNGIGVSGIAGGSGNNDGVLLMSNTIFGDNKDDFAETYVYAADNGAVISQNSWSYAAATPSINKSHKVAIDYFIATAGGNMGPMSGGVVIFATGNNGKEGTFFPSRYEAVLSVSSVSNSGKKAGYSNYGTWVDVSAPGGDQAKSGITAGVLSTIPGGEYGYFQGTSMACPHVSGVAALVVSKYAGKLSGNELKLLIEDSTDSLDHINLPYAEKIGTGRVNAFKALKYGDSKVNVPTGIFFTDIGAKTVVLNWDKTDKASRYRIKYRKANGHWIEKVTNNTSLKLYKLNKSTTYQVKIQSESLSNTSNYSAIKEFNTIALEVPNNIRVSSNDSSEVLISWEPSSIASSYTIRYKKRTDEEWVYKRTINSLSYKLKELSPNTFYEIQIKAKKEELSSIYSETISFLTLDDGSGGCDGISAWKSDKIYATTGELVVYKQKIYQNKWWTQNEIPESSLSWEKIDECAPINGNEPPKVNILSPINGGIIEQETLSSIILSAKATDSDGTIESIQFSINGNDLSKGNTISWLPNAFGSYTIKVKVTDNEGAKAMDEVKITIKQKAANQVPKVSILSPTDDVIIEQEELSAIALLAKASDSDGTIESVQFSVNGTNLSEGNTISWLPNVFGDYIIKVVAMDDKGAIAIDEVNITIKEKVTGDSCKDIQAWSVNKEYTVKGIQVVYNGIIYESKWWTRGDEPGTGGSWAPWKLIGSCTIEKNINNLITIAPNPTQGLLKLQLGNLFSNLTKVKLSSLSGTKQLVLEKSKRKIGELIYNISSLPKGVYVLEIILGKQMYSKKVIIK